MKVKRLGRLLLCGITLCMLAACAPKWELLISDGSTSGSLTAADWRTVERKLAASDRPEDAILLERALWEAGIPVVRELQIAEESWYWQDIYDQAWLLRDGQIRIVDRLFSPSQIETRALSDAADALDLIDLTPTIAGALGAPSPEYTKGRSLGPWKATRVVLVMIDGLSYDHHASLAGQSITPLLDSLGQPRRARSVYPSTPEGALEAILVGAPRSLLDSTDERESLLGTISKAGKAVRIYTAASPPALGLAEESDQVFFEGTSDSDLILEALQVLQEDAPALTVVQLHDLAAVITEHGFQADETMTELRATDQRVHELLWSSPKDTLFLVCAGFGMHAMRDDANTVAGWGTLLPTDMLIPVWATQI